jgi:hypothetical protein
LKPIFIDRLVSASSSLPASSRAFVETIEAAGLLDFATLAAAFATTDYATDRRVLEVTVLTV